jgi:hypothetical protein
MKTLLTILSCLVVFSFVHPAAARPVSEGVALTVYNNEFAVVRQRKEMEFTKGQNTVKFTDVASAIDPTTVNFKSLSDPGSVKILEQNYENDLANTSSLLKRYIDKSVIVHVKGSGSDQGLVIEGTLSAAMGSDLILQKPDGSMNIISRDSVERITLAQMPEDLVTKPTLVWLADSKKSSSQLCQVTYTTGAISWHADYSAILSENEETIDLTGWVTIDNRSGAGYKDASIKLMAGDVRRVQEQMPRMRMEKMVFAMDGGQAPFAEKAFMDYHIYTLNRTSTINNNQIKQIELITPARGVEVKKKYLYKWQNNPKKVQIKIEFKNEEQNNLGIPLPKGKVRVFKADEADGTLEFVGEDLIDHTAKDEKLSLYIGDAFDVVPEHTLTDSGSGRRTSTEAHKIELRNKKDQAVSVIVEQTFGQNKNWKVDKASQKYTKHDAKTLRFEVDIEPSSKITIEYAVTQTW